MTNRVDHWDQITTRMSKGFVRDAIGSSIVLVTAKKDSVEMEKMHSTPLAFPDMAGLSQYAWDRGFDAAKNPGVWFVKTATSHDHVFRSFSPIRYETKDEVFAGSAGVIRSFANGATELALFQGQIVGAKGVRLELAKDAEAAISVRLEKTGDLHGVYQAKTPATLTLQLPAGSDPEKIAYIDGVRAEQTKTESGVVLHLPEGRHAWEMTRHAPTPLPPVILRTVNGKGSTKVFFSPVAGATSYRAELSSDGGTSWKTVATNVASLLTLNGLHNATKVHVRIVALNADRQESFGDEYPVYVSDKVPVFPDGLAIETAPNLVRLSWGEVLGASEYRLYRRAAGQTSWTMVYHGGDRAFDDHADGVTSPVYMPGRADNALRPPSGQVFDYAVTAVDDVGESAKSFSVSSDPTGWLAWWPQGVPRKFKRQTGFWLPPYVPTEMTPPLYYPN